MSKGKDAQKNKKKKTDERMEESVMEDALLRVPVGMGGCCHWPYKFMIWKTGNRRHAVMDGVMAI